MPRLARMMLAAAAAILAGPASAAETVDVELVLAVDVSLSMSPMELEIQRDGYAAALTDDRVLQAIAEGAYGKIAVTYFEWAGVTTQHVIVPWTIIASREDAYKYVQRNAMPVWRGEGDFQTLLKKDPDVKKHLSDADIEEQFDLGYHFKHVDTIFKRVFGES